jgi:hypothetical protein
MAVVGTLAALLTIASAFGFRINLARITIPNIAQLAENDLTPTMTRVAVAAEVQPEGKATVAKVVVTTPEPTPTETAVPTSTGIPTPSISSLPAVNLLVEELNRINYSDPRTTTFDDPQNGKEDIGIEVWLAEYAPENPHLIEMFTHLNEHEWEKAREAALLAQKLEPDLATLPEDIVAAFVSRSGSYESIPTPASVQVAEADATEESAADDSETTKDHEVAPTKEVEGSRVALSAPEQPQVDYGRVEEPARAAVVAPAETPFSAVAAAEDLAAKQTAVTVAEIKKIEAAAQAYNSATYLQQNQVMAQATQAASIAADATRTRQDAYEQQIMSQWRDGTATSQAVYESYAFATPNAPMLVARPQVVPEPVYVAPPPEVVAPQPAYVESPPVYALEVNQPLAPSAPPLSADGTNVYMPQVVVEAPPAVEQPASNEKFLPMIVKPPVGYDTANFSYAPDGGNGYQQNLNFEQMGPAVPPQTTDNGEVYLPKMQKQAPGFDTPSFSYAPGDSGSSWQVNLSMNPVGPEAPVAPTPVYLPMKMKE